MYLNIYILYTHMPRFPDIYKQFTSIKILINYYCINICNEEYSLILIGPTKINSISSPPCFQEVALGQQYLQSQSTLEMRGAFSGQEFSGG